MFVVVYRWKLKAGAEAGFQEAWAKMTEAIYAARGSLGSRLHRAEDGSYVATAQWPSRAAWEASRALGSANPELGAKMAAAIEASLGEDHLEVIDDRFRQTR